MRYGSGNFARLKAAATLRSRSAGSQDESRSGAIHKFKGKRGPRKWWRPGRLGRSPSNRSSEAGPVLAMNRAVARLASSALTVAPRGSGAPIGLRRVAMC